MFYFLCGHRKGSKTQKKPLGLRNYTILPKINDAWTGEEAPTRGLAGASAVTREWQVNKWEEANRT